MIEAIGLAFAAGAICTSVAIFVFVVNPLERAARETTESLRRMARGDRQ